MKWPRSRSLLQEVYGHEVTGTHHHSGIYRNWFQPDLTGSFLFLFLFFFVKQRSLDSWSTASLYLCFARWISGNHWKSFIHCFFSTSTMIVTVSGQTRRLRSDSRLILRESLMLWCKLGTLTVKYWLGQSHLLTEGGGDGSVMKCGLLF